MKKDITINNCTLIAAANFGGTICEYMLKKLTKEEKEVLMDAQILDDSNDNYAVFRLIDGEYSDDGWYVSWKTVDEVLDSVWNEFGNTVMDEVNYPNENEEVSTYLKENEYFIYMESEE